MPSRYTFHPARKKARSPEALSFTYNVGTEQSPSLHAEMTENLFPGRNPTRDIASTRIHQKQFSVHFSPPRANERTEFYALTANHIPVIQAKPGCFIHPQAGESPASRSELPPILSLQKPRSSHSSNGRYIPQLRAPHQVT